MRLYKVLIFVLLLGGCLIVGCRKHSVPLRSSNALSMQEKREIFFVAEGAFFCNMGKGLEEGLNSSDIIKTIVKSAFPEVDELYRLEPGTATTIWEDGKGKNWQIGEDIKIALINLIEKKTCSAHDIKTLLGKKNDTMPKTDQNESQVIDKLVNNIRQAKNASERYRSLDRLIEFGDSAGAPLIATLKDKDPYVRGFAAFGLSKIGDKRAIKPLIDSLNDYEVFDFGIYPPIYVAHSAAEALATFRDSSIIPDLKIALDVAKRKDEVKLNRWDSIEAHVANREFIKTLKIIINELESEAGKKTQMSITDLSSNELPQQIVRNQDKPGGSVTFIIDPELWRAINKYLEVPDKGDPDAVLTDKDMEKISEAYGIAQEYAFEHPDDPWGEYISAYGRANLFFDVSPNLFELSRKLPEKQAVLSKRLVDARAKGLQGSREFSRTLGDIWQDFVILSEAQKTK